MALRPPLPRALRATLPPRTRPAVPTRAPRPGSAPRLTPPPAGTRRAVAAWLASIGAPARKRVIEEFYNAPSVDEAVALLAPGFTFREDGSARAFTAADWAAVTRAATFSIPDWTWGATTDGVVDGDGYALAFLEPSGHFTGAPYRAPFHPDWPLLAPTGAHFALPQETVKVKVSGGLIEEMLALPARGGGPRGLYRALGGTVPPAE